jgi:hypothetical protein
MLTASSSTTHAAAIIQKHWNKRQDKRAVVTDPLVLQKLSRAGRRNTANSEHRGSWKRWERRGSADQAVASVLDRQQWRNDLIHVKEFFYPDISRTAPLDKESKEEEERQEKAGTERFYLWQEMKQMYGSLAESRTLIDLPCLRSDSTKDIAKIMLGRLTVNQVIDKNQHKNALQSLNQDDETGELFSEAELTQLNIRQLRTRADMMAIDQAEIDTALEADDPAAAMRDMLREAQQAYGADKKVANELFVKTARRGVPLITTDLRKKNEPLTASQPFILAYAKLKRKQVTRRRNDAHPPPSETSSDTNGRSERGRNDRPAVDVTDAEIEEMFHKWDKNGNGLLDRDELVDVIKELLEGDTDDGLASELADEFIRAFNTDHESSCSCTSRQKHDANGIHVDDFKRYWTQREKRTRFVFLIIQDETVASGNSDLPPSAAEALAFFLCEQAQSMTDGLSSAADAATIKTIIAANVSAALPEMTERWQPALVDLCKEVGTARLLVDLDETPEGRQRLFDEPLQTLQNKCGNLERTAESLNVDKLADFKTDVERRLQTFFEVHKRLTKTSQFEGLIEKHLRDLHRRDLRKAIIRMSYQLELEFDERDVADFLKGFERADERRIVEAASKIFADQCQKQPYVDVLCRREKIPCWPGRGNRKTIKTQRVKQIETHERSDSMLSVRELLPDDCNPPGSLRGVLAWTHRVQSIRGFDDTWQDRQQANVACRAGAIALLIVYPESDHEKLSTPEQIDPAVDIPVVAVPSSAVELLEELETADAGSNHALKLAVNGGRSRYLERMNDMLKGLPPDALLTRTAYKDGEMPLSGMCANPLLDWRLLESTVMEMFQRFTPAAPMRSKQVKSHSVDVGRAMYEAVLRLAPTPEHFTGFWLAIWGPSLDPLCIALDRHNVALARDLVDRLSKSSDENKKDVEKGLEARAHWIDALQEGSQVARIDRDGNVDHSGRVVSRVNDRGEYKVSWAGSAGSEWVHRSQLEQPHSTRLSIRVRDDFVSVDASRPRKSTDKAPQMRELPAAIQAQTTLHVRGVGKQRQDLCNPDEIKFELQKELEDELIKQFSEVCGNETVVRATVRHRVEKQEANADEGEVATYRNTSWALVTMASPEAAQKALDAKAQQDLSPLSVSLFDEQQAKKSKGSLRTTMSKHNIRQHNNSKAQSKRAQKRWSTIRELQQNKQLQRGKERRRVNPPVAKTTMTLATAPNMVDNIRILYKRGLNKLATGLLKDHSIIDAPYELLIKNAKLDANSGVISAGSMDLHPTHFTKERWEQGLLNRRRGGRSSNREERQGIDWSDFLNRSQYHNELYGKSSRRKYFPEVKPQILGVRGAARAGEDGLLHVLVEPYTPISVFDIKAVELLIGHKWNAFGRSTFIQEFLLFAIRITAWQTLAATISEYGIDNIGSIATSDSTLDTMQSFDNNKNYQNLLNIFGVLLAFFSGDKWTTMVRRVLPLSSHSPHYLFAGERISWLSWNTVLGWEVDTEEDIWSPLSFGLRHVFRLPAPVALFVWFIIVLPCYYVLALAAHLGALVTSWFMLGATMPDLVGVLEQRNMHNVQKWSDENIRSLGAVSMSVLVALTGRAVAQESRQFQASGSWRDYFLRDVWDMLDVFTLLLTMTTVVLAVLHLAEGINIAQLAVVNTVLLWFRMVQMLSGFQRTARYVSMFFAVTSDMSSFLVMMLIFIIANVRAATAAQLPCVCAAAHCESY